MNENGLYLIAQEATVKDALVALNNQPGNTLTLFVTDSDSRIVGTLTDGDIRRCLIAGHSLQDCVSECMNRGFRHINECGIDVKHLREYKKMGIKLLPCLDAEGKISHIINLNKQKSALPLDAVLMAGGKGERLRPLTEKTPKPLLKVGERAIIDYNIDNLINYGVRNIAVTVNYLGDQIESHFERPVEGIQVRCVREPEYLGTIGSLKFVDGLSNEDILVMNSDLFTNIDYEDFFLHYKENQADMSIAAVPYSVSVPYGIFELDGREIRGVKEKPVYNYYANAGIYLIKRRLLDMIPDRSYFNATDFMMKLIENGHRVVRFPITGYWIDIGKHEEYQKAQDFAKHLGK